MVQSFVVVLSGPNFNSSLNPLEEKVDALRLFELGFTQSAFVSLKESELYGAVKPYVLVLKSHVTELT